MNTGLPINRKNLQKFLSEFYKTSVQLIEMREFSNSTDKVKGLGYGAPFLLEVDVQGTPEKLVLHTIRPDKYGHERRSDRAQSILFDFDTFDKLPRHVPALMLGAFTRNGQLRSLEDTEEFFLVTKYFPGRLYAEDLKVLNADAPLLDNDKSRALALADYLVDIHSKKCDQPSLYRRCIRDLLGHGEGIMGLTDSYPVDFSVAPPARLHAIEKKLIDWRWRLKSQTKRLSQVHGDFHPWNILFNADGEFAVLDRSRNEFGEPADDVTAMSINHIFFSLQSSGSLSGAFRMLHQLFWERYIQGSQDLDIFNFVQPFYAWRALVLAHPEWYPNLRNDTREKLFTFIERVLQTDRFEPKQVNYYLGETS